MKVLVTGAAGQLGSVVARHLRHAGFDVLPTDRVACGDAHAPGRIADLLDAATAAALVQGRDAVVHLANHPWFVGPGGQRELSENLAMNANVFRAAADAGVRKIVFASSIHVVAGEAWHGRPPTRSGLAYLPLDDDSPERPASPYALSKVLGERMLRYEAETAGLQGVALRFPGMGAAGRPYKTRVSGNPFWGRDEAFARLTTIEAARLVEHVLRADLPGFRTYLPALDHPRIDLPVPEIIRAWFPDVPLRRPVESLRSLVDLARVTRETGWSPADGHHHE